MQKLQFEAAWEKTISTQDRLLIEELFHRTKDDSQNEISCCIFRTAINHKHQLLITTLIHNSTAQFLYFQNREVICVTKEREIPQFFTIKALTIPPHTSMPWTFIYDDSSDFLLTEILKVEIK